MSTDLTAHEKRTLADVSVAITKGNLAAAERKLILLMASSPSRNDHPDVLRMLAAIQLRRGDQRSAIDYLQLALSARPDDLAMLGELATLLHTIGRFDEVLVLQQHVCELDPTNSRAWFNLGKALRPLKRFNESREAFEKALTLEAKFAPIHIALGNTLKSLGDIAGAVRCFRRAIEIDPRSGLAWINLSNTKTSNLNDADVIRLRQTLSDKQLNADTRIRLGFSLAKALGDVGEHTQAFATMVEANLLKRSRLKWNAGHSTRAMDALRGAFSRVDPGSSEGDLGREAIFVASLPRSGSTLIEQILAAHPLVTGADELDDLPAVIEAESKLRGKSVLSWAPEATPADWHRLGQDYLHRTERWREKTAYFTDKGMGNWPLIGAIRVMLPGARIVICRRDPLETCFSCFSTLFQEGHAFTYDLADCAAYWHDFDRMCRFWKAQFGAQVYEQTYEALQNDQEGETRRLLNYCGLPFDAACLRFYETERAVSTISAAQVREPMRRDTAKADRYGALLDPLRTALATKSNNT
ncbi:MAG: sulfotransferase [Dokdonella sp.]